MELNDFHKYILKKIFHSDQDPFIMPFLPKEDIEHLEAMVEMGLIGYDWKEGTVYSLHLKDRGFAEIERIKAEEAKDQKAQKG